MRPGLLLAPRRVPGERVSIPPHSALPRLRTGARHHLFVPQPCPPPRRAGAGAGGDPVSRAQFPARRKPSGSPGSEDTAAAGQIQEGFSQPAHGPGSPAVGGWGERGDSSRIAAAVCPSFATCLREGEFQPEHPMPCDSVLCLSPVTVYFPPKVLGYWIL